MGKSLKKGHLELLLGRKKKMSGPSTNKGSEKEEQMPKKGTEATAPKHPLLLQFSFGPT